MTYIIECGIAKRQEVVGGSYNDALHYFQQEFLNKLGGLRISFPNRQGGNSNTGNTANRFFMSAGITSQILCLSEELIQSIWKLLTFLNSTHQSFSPESFKLEARICFQLANVELVPYKQMTGTFHMVLAHGAQVMKYYLDNFNLPVGCFTEASGELFNKYVKHSHRFLSRKMG